MKLIRRRRSPTPADRAFKITKLAVRGLVAQRVARTTVKTAKWVRRLPVIAGAAGIGYLALKKLRGSGDGGSPETWTAPPAAPPSAPPTTPPPNPVETAGTGTPAPETGPEAGGGPDVPSEGDGAPDPDLPAAAATDAGTTGGGSEAVEATSDPGEDASIEIGEDLAAAAGGEAEASANGGGETGEIPGPGEEDPRAPAPDEEPADKG
jgi:hypothetical protein